VIDPEFPVDAASFGAAAIEDEAFRVDDFADLDDVLSQFPSTGDVAFDAPANAALATSVEAAFAAPAEPTPSSPIESAPSKPAAAPAVAFSAAVKLSALAPVATDTPTMLQPRVPSLEELDPELPALVDDAWSEQPDVYVLPAAVEAARATADEGPGPWPPVIADDPVEAPIAAFEAAPEPAAASAAPIRRPSLGALNKFLRRVETRRSAVVAEYLAG
jgi:hypothetical protein